MDKEFEAITWVPHMLFLVVTLAVYMGFLYGFGSQDIDTSTEDMQSLVEVFLHEVSRVEQFTQQVDYLTIDVATFEQIDMSQKILTDREGLAVQLALRYGEKQHDLYYVEGKENTKEAFDKVLVLEEFSSRITKHSPYPVVKDVVVVTEEGEQAGQLFIWMVQKT